MALTVTITTPLTDDDRRVLTALMGGAAALRPYQQEALEQIPNAPFSLDPNTGKSLVPPADAPQPDPTDASETVPDAGALDSSGLPWDEQIHSSNHKQNADGTWQKRRGVQDAVFDKRVAELRLLLAAPATDETAQALLASQAPTPPAPVEVPAPPVPAAPPAPADVPTADEWTGQPGFLKVMKLVTTRQRDGTLTQEQINGLLAQVLPEGTAISMASMLKADANTRETFAALVDATV